MPKIKSNLSKELSESRKEYSWNNGQLFGAENNADSFTGGGFKNKEKAIETLRLLEDKDITYQYHVISTLYNRAKVILKRTKDAEKIKNLTEGVEVFEKWVEDYKGHCRHKENFGYLSFDVVSAYEKLAEYHKLEDNGFLEAYGEVDGDYKKLRNKIVRNLEITWDVYRNRSLRPLVKEINDKNPCMFETKEPLNGLPTKLHLQIIMWGYSPDASKIKKNMNLVDEKVQKWIHAYRVPRYVLNEYLFLRICNIYV